MAWRLGLSAGFLALGLAACSGPIALYHKVEGGAIAANRQPPPGSDQPYPNLAAVPSAPVALSPARQAAVNRRLAGTGAPTLAPNAGALAGLELPGTAPAAPEIPGISIPDEPVAHNSAPPPASTAAAPAPAASAPVSLAFAPGSAVLTADSATALAGLASARGNGFILVAGFGDAATPGDRDALQLGLARAQRLANGCTADGVPAAAIRMVAAAAGSGGFVQIVY